MQKQLQRAVEGENGAALQVTELPLPAVMLAQPDLQFHIGGVLHQVHHLAVGDLEALAAAGHGHFQPYVAVSVRRKSSVNRNVFT